MKKLGVAISGTGSYKPKKILTNHDLEKMVDTSDEWIRTRTGIRERRIAAPDEATSDMACRAALEALEDANLTPENLDLILVATFTPDRPLPNTGCYLQQKLGAVNAASFSLEAACSGFIYGLEVGTNLVRSGGYRNVLVVGAEKLSSVVDWTDRETCVLFGDGAGAAILSQTEAEKDSVLSVTLGSDGNYASLLSVPAGGSELPLSHELLEQHENHIKMRGREVFKLAVNAMSGAAREVLEEAGVSVDDVRWLVPHQANTRIITSVGKKLGFHPDNVFVNLDKYGNTSAATIPVALDEISKGGMVKRGDYILLVAFGGGLTWGAALLRW
ncbi:MAG: beta-ketoacyl-ACP synthase III [Lentisphaeria bacterium]